MFRRLLLMIVVLAAASVPCPGQPRPDMPGPVTDLPNELVSEMNDAWERLRNPRILVTTGVAQGQQLVYDANMHAANRLEASLVQQLMRAFPGGIVAFDVARAREANVLNGLRRDLGAALAPQAERTLAQAFNADILIDVTLISAGGNRYAPSMRAVDTRNAREIARTSLVAIDLVSAGPTSHVYGTRLADVFGRGLIAAAGDAGRRGVAQTYTIRVLASSKEGGLSSRDLRRLAGEIEELRGVSWAETREAAAGAERFGVLEVRFTGRFRDLLDRIEDTVLPKQELAWTTQSVDGVDAVVYVYGAQRPAWHRLTDPSDRGFGETMRLRTARLERERPRLGIVVGDDIDDAPTLFGSEAPEMRTRFSDDQLAGALSNLFSDLGFTVVDRMSVARQLRRERDNAAKYESHADLAAAMSAITGVDLILHVDVEGQGDSRRLNAVLYDVDRARFLGQEQWPNSSANRLSAYPVDGQEHTEVARFLAGRLLERWDRLAGNDARTVDVRVRNVTDASEVVALTEMLGDLAGIDGVVDLHITTGLGSFELLTSKNPVELLPVVADGVGRWRPGTEILIDGRTLILNLDPKLRPSDVAATGDAGATPAQGDRSGPAAEGSLDQVRAAVASARESVSVVGWKHRNQFVPQGTAWTVSDSMLATNAHVIVGLYTRLPEYAQGLGWNIDEVRFVARRGPGLEHELVLGRTFVHPEYFKQNERTLNYLRDVMRRQGLQPNDAAGRFSINTSNFVGAFDVGVIQVVHGSPGKPLPLADDEHLHRITPPMACGYAGFPMENIRSANDAPVMATNIGWVSAVTGFDHIVRDAKTNQLLHYDLLTAGGASGSPVLDASGRVIGLNSAGSYLVFDRVVATPDRDAKPNPDGSRPVRLVNEEAPRIRTGFAYAQRVDTLRDLLNGNAFEVTRDLFTKK